MNRQKTTSLTLKQRLVFLLAWICILVTTTQAADNSVTAPDLSTIDATRAKTLFDKGAVFVDVRPTSAWEAGRIPHAIHLELDKMLVPAALGAIASKTEPIVMYDTGQPDADSTTAVTQARSWGYTQVYDFSSGFAAWQAASYPIE